MRTRDRDPPSERRDQRTGQEAVREMADTQAEALASLQISTSPAPTGPCPSDQKYKYKSFLDHNCCSAPIEIKIDI